MPDSIDPGKMTSSAANGVLTIQRRTYRSGDFVHVIFSAFSTVFAVMFFVIAVMNDTLFNGFATPIVIFGLGAYGYFGVTRLVNKRVVTVAADQITAKDRPLPQFARSVDASFNDYGIVEVRSAMRFTFPPTSRYRLYSVGGERAPDLFRRLRSEDEANYAVATITAFTAASS